MESQKLKWYIQAYNGRMKIIYVRVSWPNLNEVSVPMSDDKRLTPQEQSLIRRNISIDGDGNVVGNNNNVQVIKQTAGDYAVQIGEQRITVNAAELHQILNVTYNVRGDLIVTYQESQVVMPSKEALATHRQALQERIQARSRRWGGLTAYMQEKGVTLPIEASPYETGWMGVREGLLPALLTADRLLVLGGPGSGKTVSLQRLAWEISRDPDAPLPVLTELFRYAGEPLSDWVLAALQETGCLRLDDTRALKAFLKQGSSRFMFLLDGLNEVQPAYRDTLVSEVVRWMKTYPEHPVVITSRPQDELWRRLREEMDRVLVVQPVEDEQARQYLINHLPETGADLYDKLDERLREMVRTPLILWLIKEAGAAEESIPGNRGELYRRFVSRMLRRDTRRQMDAAIPEQKKRDALRTLAYHLSLDQRLTCTREEAERIITTVLDDVAQPSKVLDACARHGLLAGDEDLWFAPHQTVQEYFAAQALCERWQKEQQQSILLRWWQRAQGRSVLHLAGDDWWTEPFVQMAGLINNTDTLARSLARENPWLAWWCVEEGQDVKEKTRAVVEDRSTKLLQSSNVANRRRAVAALARMQNARSVPSLIRAAGDEDQEIIQLAVRALGNLGKAIWPQITVAFQDRALRMGTMRYVTAYPDPKLCQLVVQTMNLVLGFSVMWVPAGMFLMGSDKARDQRGYDDEFPQHEIMLSDYWIAKTPVTVSQFRDFAVEHHWSDRESLERPDNHPMVRVNWLDALAYCRWLGEKTGLPVTLPNEAEWEKAARGTDGRIYPWGDTSPTENLCNFGGNVGGTTSVGTYSPQGDSPYGCADMAGNVWEWTRSPYKDYPYETQDGWEDLKVDDARVLRGGAFGYSRDFVRTANRGKRNPHHRNSYYGFRIAISLSN